MTTLPLNVDHLDGMTFVCSQCETAGSARQHVVRPGTPPHWARLDCRQCGRLIRWLKPPDARPTRSDKNSKHRAEWLARHGGDLICGLCSARQSENDRVDYHIDHIWALEDGGPDVIDNTMPLCRTCHGLKNLMRTHWRHGRGLSSRPGTGAA